WPYTSHSGTTHARLSSGLWDDFSFFIPLAYSSCQVSHSVGDNLTFQPPHIILVKEKKSSEKPIQSPGPILSVHLQFSAYSRHMQVNCAKFTTNITKLHAYL
ncbi:MAG: hypothetical protein AAF702_30225, partial [Chloroflexota bacterium]